MTAFLQSVFGTYTPPTYEVYNFTADGDVFISNVIPDGLAGVDWLYVSQVALFIVAFYAFCRIIGGLICRTS